MLEDKLKKFLEEFNPWWKDKKFRFDVKSRGYYQHDLENFDNRLVKILIGARRVGKTSILYSIINYLLGKNIDPQKIIFLSCDLREIQQIGIRDTVELVTQIHQYNLSNEELYILIDEIPEVKNWSEEVKLLYDNTKIRFFISGSSASILSSKTSKLTGRYELTRILPLSFKEYLDFNDLPTDTKYIEDKHLIQYLHDGGYPEKINKKLPGYLNNILESTLYRDIIEDYGIRNPSLLMQILKLLADKVTAPVSSNRVSKDLGVDNETAKNYLKYIQDVYLIYPLYKNAGSNKISLNIPPKYYFNDTGILNILCMRTRIGHLAENAVFLELLRRQYKKEKYELFYENINNQEFDFSTGRKLFEVKLNEETEDHSKLFDYELDQRSKAFFSTPNMITNPDLLRVITEQGYELKGIDIKEFLLGIDE